MKRRELIAAAAIGAAAIATRTTGVRAAAAAPPKTFLLVHGSWHGAVHWARVAERLSGAGHRVVAIDLPGHGLKARFPASYLTGDQAGFETEVSPLREISLDDCATAVIDALAGLQGETRPILVGHSAGGIVITRAAELAPERVGRLVYLAAYVPLRLNRASAYGALPEAQTGYGWDLFIGDIDRIGAARINPRGDAAYLEALRTAYYHDVAPADFLPFALALTPDFPAALWTADVGATPERWGRIPRSYIRCLQDRAIAPALQELMIRDADAFTPGNRFDVATLEASHSAFASQPAALADILGRLA